jgi:hypothetical protein
MRRPTLTVLAALSALLLPSLGAAQSSVPSGVTASLSLAGGAELGLASNAGGAGLGELEGAIGYEFESVGLRPELGLVIGLAPGSDFAFRPGVRLALPGVPLQFRAALDASTARVSGLSWRWLLLGVATELRFTSTLALFGELDSGAPLNSRAGLPLLFRAGAAFRF